MNPSTQMKKVNTKGDVQVISPILKKQIIVLLVRTITALSLEDYDKARTYLNEVTIKLAPLFGKEIFK